MSQIQDARSGAALERIYMYIEDYQQRKYPDQHIRENLEARLKKMSPDEQIVVNMFINECFNALSIA